MTPFIGITVDFENNGGYSKYPWFALREHYSAAVGRAGGAPVLLPHETGSVDHYAAVCAGLLVSGGDFDVDPALYGAAYRHAAVTMKSARTAFELALIRRFLEMDKPILGICGGQQLLNVVLGGTLIQHIPDEIASPLAHEQPNPRDEPGHSVTISPRTLLGRIVNTPTLAVNSAHHQAVKAVPARVAINAVADDGVIEGIEHLDHRFCIGVQWHPEFEISAADTAIFASFVAACRG